MKSGRMLVVIGLLMVLWASSWAASAQVTPGDSTWISSYGNQGAGTPDLMSMDTFTVFLPFVVDYNYQNDWNLSAHADEESVSFTHWDETDPPEIPTGCAKCHSTPGFLDYLGEDGTTPWVVDNPAPTGTTVECEACHNDTAETMSTAHFASGKSITDLGRETVCLRCHQGRNSTYQVNDAIDLEDLDTVDLGLSFMNIHYYYAADILFGTEIQGGYEYEGEAYDPRYDHEDGYKTCIECHEPHILTVSLAICRNCHPGLLREDDLKDIRLEGSGADYDGDGDLNEGVYYEVVGLQSKLLQAIQAYADDIPNAPIVYTDYAYPYFFIDLNDNGQPDPEETVPENSYASWTGRLLRAAYNYQVSMKDPGGYTHGAKYLIQLLYDSIDDLNSMPNVNIDLSTAHRLDVGHFAASNYPWRHWDAEDVVPTSCSRCHTASGLPTFIELGYNQNADHTSGLHCSTCHDDLTSYTLYELSSVEFPTDSCLIAAIWVATSVFSATRDAAQPRT